MPLHYQSGEPIGSGDHVLIHGEKGEVEFVADPLTDPDDWYVREFGGGVMVTAQVIFGRVFLSAPIMDEDLKFLSRADKAEGSNQPPAAPL